MPDYKLTPFEAFRSAKGVRKGDPLPGMIVCRVPGFDAERVAKLIARALNNYTACREAHPDE